MTSKNFIIWLRGFTAAANNFTLTPEQWDTLKDELAQVHDDEMVDKPHYDWNEEETNERIDVIGQNGNEGTHYWTSTNTGKQLLKD